MADLGMPTLTITIKKAAETVVTRLKEGCGHDCVGHPRLPRTLHRETWRTSRTSWGQM